MIKIKIYRADQIGGCVTVIETDNSKIVIDFGEELEKTDKLLPTDEIFTNCNAVFFTHYHGDHFANYKNVPKEIPMYIGKIAKDVYREIIKRKDKENIVFFENILTFQTLDSIVIKDITVKPFYIDHSAFDAYMFLIEIGDKKILHTGDFRTHGLKKDTLIQMLDKYIKRVDVLITEGTMLSRSNENVVSENDISNQIQNAMEDKKYVFILCSSTNIDRIYSSYIANKNYKRLFVCDKYQKDILRVVNMKGHYKFKEEYLFSYAKNLDKHMLKQGFCVLVRYSSYHDNLTFKETIDKYYKNHKDQTLIIYSMWRGYLQGKNKNERLAECLSNYEDICRKIHTSGHATADTIKSVISRVEPKVIMPIHCSDVRDIKNLIQNNINIINDVKNGIMGYNL